MPKSPYIIGNICNSFFARIVRAVETAVMRYGYKVIVCDTDESIEYELDHARVLLEHRVDGIIVSPTASETGHVSRAIKELLREQDAHRFYRSCRARSKDTNRRQ